MKSKLGTKHKFGGLAALLLFGVFAVCILSVLLTGASAYKRLAARNDGSYDIRTCTQYIATKIHRAQFTNAISVEDFGGTNCLVLAEKIEGDTYLTRIYSYNGWLYELFCPLEGDFSPADGEKILEADHLEFSMLEGDLLRLSVNDASGFPVVMYLTTRSGEEAAE